LLPRTTPIDYVAFNKEESSLKIKDGGCCNLPLSSVDSKFVFALSLAAFSVESRSTLEAFLLLDRTGEAIPLLNFLFRFLELFCAGNMVAFHAPIPSTAPTVWESMTLGLIFGFLVDAPNSSSCVAPMAVLC
jgi:hypothetical protein